jgi:hypothetical protein
MWTAPLRLYAINALIAVILLIVVIDMLPQSPSAVRLAMMPISTRLGINQGQWTLFAPEPDRVNTRLKAEITYRDDERRQWIGPDWRAVSAWEKWTGHRRREWFDHIALQTGAPAWEPWCRYLARTQRPDLEYADHGAEVRVIYREASIPPAECRPWPSIREPAKFDDGWVLTIEKLERTPSP